MPCLQYAGKQLYYRISGSGPLLILLPGNTASSASFKSEIEHFAYRYTVVAFDFLGTGRSDRIPDWPVNWWRDNAKQVSAIIAHLRLGPALLCGTSGGGITALFTAADFPAQVQAVVADSVPAKINEKFIQNILEERRNPTEAMQQFYQTAQGEDWQTVISQDNTMLEQFFNQSAGAVFGKELRAIRCPVLITSSRQDNFLIDIDQTQTALVKMLRYGRLYVGPQGGHPFMWTASEEFRGVSDSFLKLIG